MIRNLSIILTLFILILETSSNSQELLEEISQLEYNWGSVEYSTDIYLHENVLYTFGIACSSNHYPPTYAVGIFDISNPENPEELGRHVQGIYSGNPAYENSISYYSNAELSMPYYSISNSSNQILHYFWQPSTCILINDLLFEFQDWKQELNIYEKQSSGEFTFVRKDSLEHEIHEITGIEVIGSIIYITNRGTGLVILDVSNPASILEIENDFYGQDLTGIIIGDGKAVIGNDFRYVDFVDISDPINPSLITSEYFFHHRLSGYFKNSKFYANCHTQAIRIFNDDLSHDNEIPTKGAALEFILDDNKMIVSSNFGIEIYDITNENEPESHALYGANIAKPVNFEKQNDLLFVVNRGDGIEVIDVSDRSAPLLRSDYDFNGYSLDVVIKGNYGYVADYLLGLLIVDISDPDAVELISTVPIDGASALDIMGDKVFLLNDDNVLYVIDVSNKADPQIEFSKSFDKDVDSYYGRYKDIMAAGGSIWIKFSWGPLWGFEYSSETGLNEIFNHTYEYSSEPYEFQWYEPYLFITHFNGTQIIDPYARSFVREEVFGSLNMETSPYSVAADMDNDIVYISLMVVGTSGIVAYDISNPQEPTYTHYYLPLGFASEEMLFDDGILYVLTPTGIAMYSPQIISSVDDREVPYTYQLHPNYPNPFNPSTTIAFTLPEAGQVSVNIYNITGQKIETLAEGYMDAGMHTVAWDSNGFAAGMYVYSVRYNGHVETRTMTLVK